MPVAASARARNPAAVSAFAPEQGLALVPRPSAHSVPVYPYPLAASCSLA